MSEKTLLTFNTLAKDVKISWLIVNSCLIQQFPNWFIETSLFTEKKLEISFKISKKFYRKSEVEKLKDNFWYSVSIQKENLQTEELV